MNECDQLTHEQGERVARIAACSLDEQRRGAVIGTVYSAILLIYAVVQLVAPELAVVRTAAFRWMLFSASVFTMTAAVFRCGYYSLFVLIRHLENEHRRLFEELQQRREGAGEGSLRDHNKAGAPEGETVCSRESYRAS